jgi:hypothetical protein
MMYRTFVVRDVDYYRLRRFIVEHNLSWTCDLFHPRIFKMYVNCLNIKPVILRVLLLTILSWLNDFILRDKYVVVVELGG